jgi:hypothetical protein
LPRDSLPFAFTEATPTRALNTIYQNDSKPRLVVASVAVTEHSSNIESVTAYVGATSPPALERGLVGVLTLGSDYVSDYGIQVTLLVQPFYYYKLTTGGIAAELKKWVEYDLG